MGKLTLVPTPVGNLDDITIRAIRTLEAADLVFAEDTRKSGMLLDHLHIKKSLVSYHQHNEHKMLEKAVRLIREHKHCVLITDAGTPGISDPGFLLVRECIRENLPLETLPGPVAFIPALVNSGLPCEKFVFEGFLPAKKGRRKRLEMLAEEERTMVFYESPHRILKTLEAFSLHFGADRNASVSKEISKMHESTFRGTLGELLNALTNIAVKGEFVIVVAGRKQRKAAGGS